MSRHPDQHARLKATCAEVEDAFFRTWFDEEDADFDY
jgi:hypothetical protein